MRGWNPFARLRRREEDLQDEIASHLALAEQDRLAAGDHPHDARFAARKEFGNVTLTREATKLTWGSAWMDRASDLARDIRYAVRLLARSPGYSAVVTMVLALGIACNVIAFSLFKAIVLTPIAGVEQSGSLYYVGARTTGGQTWLLSYPDYRDVRDRAFPGLAFWALQPLILDEAGNGQQIWAEFVPGNYFDVLGVRPQLGRTLLPTDEIAAGRHPVIVLSDSLWRGAFGADPDIVGKTIRISAQRMTVVGVAAADFRGAVVGLASDVFVPVMMQRLLTGNDWLEQRSERNISAFMRLPAGTTREGADALAAKISAELATEDPNDTISQRAMLVPIWDWPYGAQTYMVPAIALIGATAALLLVVVCANVAGLVLVRSLGRRGEIAARLALGAGRGRILRQLTLESLVLAVPGALIGLQLPRVAEPFIGAAASNAPLPLYFNVYTDGYVIGFAVALTCLAVLAYGLGPALRLSRVDLASVLKDDLSPRGVPKSRVRTTLVVAQIATSLVLLVGTGLVLRTLDAARRADPGFDADGVTWASFDVRAGGHTERRGRQVYRQLLEAIREEPNVDSASLASYLPLTLIDFSSSDFQPEGYERRRDENLSFAVNTIGPDYFRAMRIELAAGREFEWRDDEDRERVVIVNETLARRFWGSAAAAIGKRLEGRGSRHKIVGVARDIKYARLDEQPRPYVYVPFTQTYSPNMTLQVRASAASPDVLERIRNHARQVDPNLPLLASGVLGDQMRFAVSIYETSARILALIGLVAAGLAGIGVYGVVAYTVKQRAHEIGLRTAIGAKPGAIARQFLTQGGALGIIGVTIGLIGAFALTGLMRDVLYGVTATDFVSFAAAAVAVLAVALVASLIPAWRASRVDPIAALRHR